MVGPDSGRCPWGTHASDILSWNLLLLWVHLGSGMGRGQCGLSKSWDVADGRVVPIHLSPGLQLRLSLVTWQWWHKGPVWLLASWPKQQKIFSNHGVQKTKVALKDTEQQGLFRTGADPVASPPKTECPGFVWVSFIHCKLPHSNRSDPSPPQVALVPVDIMNKQDHRSESGNWWAEAIQKQDNGRESKRLLL